MKKIIISLLLLFALISCASKKSDESQIFEIVVLPHHWLTGKNIDNYYENLQKEFESFDRIIVISPDHFGKSKTHIETILNNIAKICFYWKCVKSSSLKNSIIANISNNIFVNNGNTNEHGIGEHIIRIARFFPDAIVTPILVHPRENIVSDDEKVAHELASLSEKRILVVASVDFSHHVREEIAKIHDDIAVNALKFLNPNNFSNLEVDCRNCLAIAKFLANEKWKLWFEKQLRTSVDFITGTNSDIENTSHIFGRFIEKPSEGENQKIFLYFSDFSNNANFSNIEKNFFNRYDVQRNPKNFYHRMFSAVENIFILTSWEGVENLENFSRLRKFGITQIFSREKFFQEHLDLKEDFNQSDENKIPYFVCREWITKICNKYILDIR